MEISRIVQAPTAGSRRRRGLSIGGVAGLGVASGVDLLALGSNGNRLWPAALVLSVGLAAVVWPDGARPRWLTPPVRTMVPAITSAAYTIGVLATRTVTAFGPGESVILLCLLLIAVRTCRPVAAAMGTLVIGLCILAIPLRVGMDSPGDHDVSYWVSALLAVLACGAAALGGYLRSLDHRREAAVTQTRRTERLSMAADLHDFVAHHVTGILVQTQMARLLADTEPERLDPVLAGIEQAASEALAAMRSTVGILRTSEAGHSATGDLTALPDLVAGFHQSHGVRAVLHRDDTVPNRMPPEIQAAAYRVVREALTNVWRHAVDATEVTVDLRHADGHLHVTVQDNGTIRLAPPVTVKRGHYGLIGLSERVTALGGQFRAGPQPTGGWQLAAQLPADD